MTTLCLDALCLDGTPLADGTAQPRPTADGDCLCTRCLAALTRRIAEAPARRDLLRSILAGTSRPGSDGSKPTKGNPPVPLNLDAHDLIVEQNAVVVSWVQLVCAERDLRGPQTADLRALAPWLLGWLPWLVTQTYVADLAQEMRDLSARADGMTRHRERWERLEVPCPECQAYEVARWASLDVVRCQSCGVEWDEEKYARAITVAIDDHWLTAEDAAHRLGINHDAFRKRVSRGQIVRVGVDTAGQHRYDVDVIKALREEAS